MSDISKIKINDTTYNIKDPTARTDAASALNALDTKVSKSGDTLSGPLGIKSERVDQSTVSTDWRWEDYVLIYDKNDKLTSCFRAMQNQNNDLASEILTIRYRQDGTYVENVLSVGVGNQFNPYVYVNNPVAWLNGLGITWGTAGKTAGTTAMTNGNIYLQYE